ncbi:MAG: hypothetical protein P4N59_30100 [Negativicutes bacterium]|nr:hypothetical protein [Negativicutes bacterium]
MEDAAPKKGKGKDAANLKHVGGVNEQLGGVDPAIDETLERLSGGP